MSRIKDLSTQAYGAGSDDFVVLDGATAGTRKIAPGDAHGQFRNALAPRGGIIHDGTANIGLAAMLGAAGAIDASGNWSICGFVRIPTANPALGAAIAGLSSNAASYFASNALFAIITQSGKFELQLNTSNWSNARFMDSNENVVTLWGGKLVFLSICGNGAAQPTVRINNTALTFGADQTAGSSPADWAATVANTYFLLGFGGQGALQSVPGIFSGWSLYSFALSAADVLEIHERGGLPPERFRWGSRVNFLVGNDAGFSGAGNWAGVGTTVATVTGGQLVATGLTHSASNYLASPTWLQSSRGTRTLNRRYRVKVDVAALNLAGGATAVYVFCSAYSNAVPIGTITSTGTKTFDFDYTTGGADAGAMLGFYRKETSGTCDITIDNVSMEILGAILYSPLDDGIGRVLRDVSTNKLHFRRSPDANIEHVRLHDDGMYPQNALTANGELFDTSGILLPDAVLVDVVVKNTTASTVYGFAIAMTSGGDELTYRTDIPGNTVAVLPIKRADLAALTLGSGSPYGRCYYSALSWNSGSLNIAIRYRRERDL